MKRVSECNNFQLWINSCIRYKTQTKNGTKCQKQKKNHLRTKIAKHNHQNKKKTTYKKNKQDGFALRAKKKWNSKKKKNVARTRDPGGGPDSPQSLSQHPHSMHATEHCSRLCIHFAQAEYAHFSGGWSLGWTPQAQLAGACNIFFCCFNFSARKVNSSCLFFCICFVVVSCNFRPQMILFCLWDFVPFFVYVW